MSPSRESLRLLLVEDSRPDRVLLMRLLRDTPFEATSVERLRDAIDRCRERDSIPDVILLDLSLPDAAGLEAVAGLRAQAWAMPIVVLTGDTSPGLGAEAMRAGADDFLVKGQVDGDSLTRALSFAIERGRRLEATERLARAEGLASLGRLAASVAHEINNPLQYIRHDLSQVGARLRSLPPPAELGDTLELLDQATEGVEHVAEVVSDLRALGKVGDRRVDRVEIAALVATAIRLTHNELHHRARVVVEVPEGLTLVAYPTRLLQALTNLLLNAAQSIEMGSASDHQVSVGATASDDAVVITVEDTGRGMPPELLARVTDAFVTTRAQGTGLGLALVEDVMAEHRGSVVIESAPAQGTRVRLTLPRHNGLQPPAALPAASVAALAVRRRVLLVDDDDLVRRAVRAILAQRHDVTDVASGREALAALAVDARYDALVVDLMMPDVSGAQLLSVIEARWPHLRSRVIVSSGAALTDEAERVLTSSVTLLPKPFGPEALHEAVEAVAGGGDPR
ncbi:MAG: response regulator [Sandaracinaceae bacterium]|nr:response regulator [Sandaracinaceae bacterium]